MPCASLETGVVDQNVGDLGPYWSKSIWPGSFFPCMDLSDVVYIVWTLRPVNELRPVIEMAFLVLAAGITLAGHLSNWTIHDLTLFHMGGGGFFGRPPILCFIKFEPLVQFGWHFVTFNIFLLRLFCYKEVLKIFTFSGGNSTFVARGWKITFCGFTIFGFIFVWLDFLDNNVEFLFACQLHLKSKTNLNGQPSFLFFFNG